MKRKKIQPLTLSRETILCLDPAALKIAQGGVGIICPRPDSQQTTGFSGGTCASVDVSCATA